MAFILPFSDSSSYLPLVFITCFLIVTPLRLSGLSSPLFLIRFREWGEGILDLDSLSPSRDFPVGFFPWFFCNPSPCSWVFDFLLYRKLKFIGKWIFLPRKFYMESDYPRLYSKTFPNGVTTSMASFIGDRKRILTICFGIASLWRHDGTYSLESLRLLFDVRVGAIGSILFTVKKGFFGPFSFAVRHLAGEEW